MFYHVTERDAAEDILQQGFLGGWGDDGFGVYFYDNLYDARDYVSRGGWDGGLKDPVILAVEDPEIYSIRVDPSWDASEYEHVCVHYMDDNDEHWIPQSVAVVG